MIGGNGDPKKMEEELYIRWVQASALMPVMQFSMLPCDFGRTVSALSVHAITQRWASQRHHAGDSMLPNVSALMVHAITQKRPHACHAVLMLPRDKLYGMMMHI